MAARIGVIDKGRLIGEGTPEELKDTLGGAFLEMVIDEGSRARGMEVLKAIDGEEPGFETASRRVTIAAPGGSRTLLQAVRRLDEAGIEFEDVVLRKPTLDDVFLSLTGHTAEEETAGGGNGRRGRRGRRSR